MFDNFKEVAVREIQRVFRNPVYIIATVGIMSFLYVFFFSFMGEGAPQSLPIGVVDYDHSNISRRLIREVNTTPYVDIRQQYTSFEEARDAMQRGKIYAFFVIPENFYADILAFQQPKMSFYMNQAYLMGGSLSMKELTTMANLAPAAVQRELFRARGYNDKTIMGLIQPVVVDSHLIGNPYLNYPSYLLTTVFPGILGLIILLATTYSIGVELKNKTSRQWLKTAGKSYWTALAGKLLPHTLLYIIIYMVGVFLMFFVFRFPMEGSLAFYMLGAVVFIVTMQCLGVFFIGVMPVISTGLSLAILYGILAVTMSGFTYPLEYMPPAIQGLAVLFPMRSFYLFTLDTAMLGLPIAHTAKYLLMIAVFMLMPLFVAKRLHKALIYQNYPAI
ncbi:MAG: ABC transporter permease [Bacteroidales bacterium]|nr:ABC transporter permease [Bacteroidales bacterium]